MVSSKKRPKLLKFFHSVNTEIYSNYTLSSSRSFWFDILTCLVYVESVESSVVSFIEPCQFHLDGNSVCGVLM